jgi:hypothetical protein
VDIELTWHRSTKVIGYGEEIREEIETSISWQRLTRKELPDTRWEDDNVQVG